MEKNSFAADHHITLVQDIFDAPSLTMIFINFSIPR